MAAVLNLTTLTKLHKAVPCTSFSVTCCTETYLVAGTFDNREQAENLISYIKTRFFRFFVLYKKNTQNAARGVYALVPIQDFNEPWTDEKLYSKYGFTDEEIEYIESMIRPME